MLCPLREFNFFWAIVNFFKPLTPLMTIWPFVLMVPFIWMLYSILQTSKMELFAERPFNYSRKKLYLRWLQREDWNEKGWGLLLLRKPREITLSWRRSLSYRNQCIGLLCKSLDWFLYVRTSVMKELRSNLAKHINVQQPLETHYSVRISVRI